jgi:hypothetical protein
LSHGYSTPPRKQEEKRARTWQTTARRKTNHPGPNHHGATRQEGISQHKQHLTQKGVAPQRTHESIAAFVRRVQIAVATTSREAISHTENYVKEEDNPLWNDRTEKYIAAWAIFNTRDVARPWTDTEKETIAARNQEYRREQQQETMYKCRR